LTAARPCHHPLFRLAGTGCPPPCTALYGRVKLHVASLCSKCFGCFIDMLQVFYVDVAKVDRDVAYVAMDVHVCCKLLFPMFHLFFFRRMLQVSFIWMLHMFHTYVASVLSGCCVCFTMFFRCFCKCFKCMFQVFDLLFRRMLHVLYLDVAKVDRVLHLPPHFLLPRLDFSPSLRRRLGIRRPLPSSRCWWRSGRCRPRVGT
jgi:hypothetical protein